MHIRYGCELAIVVERPAATICMIDIHPEFRSRIVSETQGLTPPELPCRSDIDAFGNVLRRFVAAPGETKIFLDGIITDPGVLDARGEAMTMVPVDELPSDGLTYLNGSRYCDTEKLNAVALSTFGHLPVDASMVEAICTYTHERLRFDYTKARATRTAYEAFEERVGVCRDFAHLAISLCRCMSIPARYVNGYLGDIGVPTDPAPMDFNAWFEVYLGGAWYTFDARHNQRRVGRLPIARGRDACDIPMLQTFGPHVLSKFHVTTEEVAGSAIEKAA